MSKTTRPLEDIVQATLQTVDDLHQFIGPVTIIGGRPLRLVLELARRTNELAVLDDNPQHCELLRENCKLNNFQHVTIEQATDGWSRQLIWGNNPLVVCQAVEHYEECLVAAAIDGVSLLLAVDNRLIKPIRCLRDLASLGLECFDVRTNQPLNEAKLLMRGLPTYLYCRHREINQLAIDSRVAGSAISPV